MRTAIRSARRAEAAVPVVVGLDHFAALDAGLAGAKAAALARAARAGLPVLPGRVVTTGAVGGAIAAELRSAWAAMSGDGDRQVIVRSSSTVEDGRTSSMAGMFTSVLDVGDFDAFRRAVDTVVESSRVVALADAGARERSRAAMAVLIQPQLTVAVGGVMFGVDPVSGSHRLVIAASAAGPSAVVSGTVDGTRYAVSRWRIVEAPPRPGGPLTHGQVRELARLGRHAARVFEGPQDVEWAYDNAGRLWLLQSRPVTVSAGREPATGPLLGPGPVAETFPDPLSTLEEDLWIPPLREGLRLAIGLGGTTPHRRLARSPLVLTVAGRAAADLRLLHADVEPVSLLHRLDPRPSLRRLVAAWRVGRLRAALPSLAGDLVATADADLLAVGRLDELSDRVLLGLLRRSGQALTALHGHEVLMGWLVAPDASAATAASVALRDLAGARAAGLTDEQTVARHPAVLALVPPRIGVRAALPSTPDGPVAFPEPTGEADRAAVLREALRLRARWVQEMTSRAAWELGVRLADRAILPDAESVRWIRLDDLSKAVATGVPPEIATGQSGPDRRAVAPLPARFRLTPGGAVVPELGASRTGRGGPAVEGGGTGAGGGRGMGRVHQGDGPPDRGAVLVVRTLDPGLAPLLPRLGGLVAESGSVLSHLAILARELGVPTVVGVRDAVSRFPGGIVLVVDGTTGGVGPPEPIQRGAA